MYANGWTHCNQETANIFRGNPSYKVEEVDEVCQTCEKPVDGSMHTCPYGEEICHSSAECNCCDNCTTNCAMEI